MNLFAICNYPKLFWKTKEVLGKSEIIIYTSLRNLNPYNCFQFLKILKSNYRPVQNLRVLPS